MVENLIFVRNLSPIVFTFRPILQVFFIPSDDPVKSPTKYESMGRMTSHIWNGK